MDRKQFEQQIEKHHADLLRYARARLKEPAESAVNDAVADLLERRAWEACKAGDDLWRFLKRAVHYRLQREFKRRKNERARLYDGTPILDRVDEWDNEAQQGLNGFYRREEDGDISQLPEFIVADPAQPDDERDDRVPDTTPRASWPSRYAEALHLRHAVRLDLAQAFETLNIPPAIRAVIWPFERSVEYAPATACKCGMPRYAETDTDGTVKATALVCVSGHREVTVDETAGPPDGQLVDRWRWQLDGLFRWGYFQGRRARSYRDIVTDGDAAFIAEAARQRVRRLRPAFERAATLTVRSPRKSPRTRPATPRPVTLDP